MSHHTNNERDFTAFAMIPTWLLRAGKQLSSNAVRLYGVLMTYADNVTREAYPGRETLAEDMGVSVATVKRVIKELEDFGAIEVIRQRGKSGNFSSNHYRLAYDAPRVTSEPRSAENESPRVTHDPRPWVTSDPPPWVTSDPLTRSNITKPNRTKSPRCVGTLRAVDDCVESGDEKHEEKALQAASGQRAPKRRADEATITLLRAAIGQTG